MNNFNHVYFKNLDKIDKLGKIRNKFDLPKNIKYFDGNSLGPLPKNTVKIVNSMIKKEWGQGLIRSWNNKDWINMPYKIGNKIAPLIGARLGEVVVTDSVSINLFKVLTSSLKLNKKRKIILSEIDNFPSDLYILESVIKMFGKNYKMKLIKKIETSLEKKIDTNTAVVMLSHVNFKTGYINDIKKITDMAHKKGALVIWDLSHSVGVIPINLKKWGVDFAVGCTYKHLNGGPGSPGFLYVNKSHIKKAYQPLTGWMGHNKPFNFHIKYKPANNIGKYLCGTPSIVAYKTIEGGLKIFENLSINEIRKKSIQLSDILIKLMEQECSKYGFKVFSPIDSRKRGSQVSFTHPNGFPIMQALISRGFIGDFRHPNILRFGISPLYMKFEDIWNLVKHLKEIMKKKEWEYAKFKKKKVVT